MPRFFCLRHIEQYYRENVKSYDVLVWYFRKGIIQQVEEKDCEHCKVGVPLFAYPVATVTQEPARVESSQ